MSENTARRSNHKRLPPYEEYMARVKHLKHLLTTNEAALQKLVEEFNRMGHEYFSTHRTGFISPGDTADSVDRDAIETLTQKQFRNQYEEEMGEPPDTESAKEASFSDAFRHAAFIDVTTLDAVNPASLDGSMFGPETDYVFSWKAIQTLPERLSGTNLVAVHADTEDGYAFWFPVPNKPKSGARKTRRASNTHNANCGAGCNRNTSPK